MTVLTKAPLKPYAYYQTGGLCERLYLPESLDELQEHIFEISKLKMPYFLLGKGTNSLVMDEPWSGAVISFAKLKAQKLKDNTLYCEAGVENSDIAQFLLSKNLAGAGWMYGLPGQIGGTVRMNARCYGGEISQIARKVIAFSPNGTRKEYQDPKIFRGYKDTIFMTNQEIVAAVELQLTPGDATEIKKLMDSCYDDRAAKGQYSYPSCGCVFKNDYSIGIPSGKLLEAVGAKQLKHGGGEVSPYHANFLFNKGGTARDVLELSLKLREMVYQHFGVWLEYEMEILGKIPADLHKEVRKMLPHKPKESLLEPLRKKWEGGVSHLTVPK
jgi:UDP-N-acetylmuramate dehydrogenase